jgi:hypothetical protein
MYISYYQYPHPFFYRVKRDLLQCQKRPTTVSKETYYQYPHPLFYRVRLLLPPLLDQMNK